MEAFATVSFTLAVIAYSVASTQFYLNLARRQKSDANYGPARVLMLGAILHGVQIVTASFFTHTCPVESMRFALSLAALVAVALFLVLRLRRNLDALGSFIGPASLALLVSAQFVGHSASPSPSVSRVLLALHVTSNLLGLGFFLLSGGAAAFYILVDARLKAKQLGTIGRLPSLNVLDEIRHKMLLIGFPLMTFGVVTGGIFISQIDTSSTAEMARAFLGYLSWLLVAGVLLLRFFRGWQGRRSAYGTLAGVICVSMVIFVYLLRPLFGEAM